MPKKKYCPSSRSPLNDTYNVTKPLPFKFPFDSQLPYEKMGAHYRHFHAFSVVPQDAMKINLR